MKTFVELTLVTQYPPSDGGDPVVLGKAFVKRNDPSVMVYDDREYGVKQGQCKIQVGLTSLHVLGNPRDIAAMFDGDET